MTCISTGSIPKILAAGLNKICDGSDVQIETDDIKPKEHETITAAQFYDLCPLPTTPTSFFPTRKMRKKMYAAIEVLGIEIGGDGSLACNKKIEAELAHLIFNLDGMSIFRNDVT